ncbi:putative polysaccharide biosynthesis protein [Lysinibacillus sp. 54212]|uniref:putative polysaccharide biosynthesis protein n=1 Tax=Lysinibacillus sp. 54212 TaxID=3119829 RepID=UPI002FCB268B
MSSQFSMKSYMKGALLLTVAALIVKVLSAVYRVPFQNLVGDQGFYVYQQVYPFIALFVVWTSGGFAVAISKMLAGTDDELRRSGIIRTIFIYLTGLSLLFFMLLFFGANLLAELMGDSALAPLLRTGAFVTLCMPSLAVMKGAFQSRGRMEPVAYAQVFEQGVRVIFILAGTVIVMSMASKSVYTAGNIAMLGTVIGQLAGVVLLIIYMRKHGQLCISSRFPLESWAMIKEVTVYSLSVSMSSLLLLTLQLVDSFTVFSLLEGTGIAKLEAMELKGIYDRGQPLVQLGIVIASSFALAIVPLIAHRAKGGGRGEVPFIQLTYRASLLFGVAASLGLIIVMPYVNTLLFKTDALSNVLIVYVVQIVPLSIILTFTAILQGYGKLKVPTSLLLGAVLLKYIANSILIPVIGVIGAAYASNLGLLVCAVSLMAYFKKVKSIRLAPPHFYMKLSVASISMVFAVKTGEWVLAGLLSLSSSRLEAFIYSAILIPIGAIVFIWCIARLRLLGTKEWFILPFGRRMALYQLWLNRKK